MRALSWTASLLLVAGCFHYNSNGIDRDGGGGDASGSDSGMTTDAAAPSGWLLDIGGAMNQSGTAIVTGRNGAIFVAGTFDGSVGIDGASLATNGASDMYVARLNADGTRAWALGFGSTRADGVPKLAVDGAGNLLMVGAFQQSIDIGGHMLTSLGGGDGFAAKLSAADGSVIWARQFGGAGSDRALAIAADGAGNVFVTGTFSGSADLGDGTVTSAGGQDIFLAKLSSDGNEYWAKHYGSAGDDLGLGVAVDSTGAPILVGSIGGGGAFGGAPLLARGGTDILVAKFHSNDGSGVWSYGWGGASDDRPSAVAVGAGDAIFVTGAITGDGDLGGGTITGANANTTDLFVVRYDASGGFGWAKSFGDVKDDAGESISVNGADVLVAGWFEGTVDFGGAGPLTSGMADGVVAAFAIADGATDWARSFGGSGNDAGRGVTFDSSSRVLVTGDFSGMADFGPTLGTFGSKGALDGVVFAFLP